MRLSSEQKSALCEYNAAVQLCEANALRRRQIKQHLRRAEKEQIELLERLEKAEKRFFDSIGFKQE